MAYWLVEEVMDHAPRHLTPAQRHLLAVLAELCRGNARVIEESLDYIAWRYGTSSKGVRKVLAKLAEAGVDVRVPIGVDKNGAPIYAVPGRVPRFRLPVFPAPAGCPCRHCTVVDNPVDNSTEGAPNGAPSGEKGPQTGPQGAPNGAPQPPQGAPNGAPSRSLSGDPVSLPPRARELASEIGASEEEMRALIEEAKKSGAKAPIPWLRTLHANGDLAERLAALRGRPPIELRPTWCGECDERTRRLEDPDGRDLGRCPNCHPLRRPA